MSYGTRVVTATDVWYLNLVQETSVLSSELPQRSPHPEVWSINGLWEIQESSGDL